MINHLRAWLALVVATLLLTIAQSAEASDAYQNVVVTEQVSAPVVVIAAYSAIWVLVVAYLVTIWRRQQRLASEIATLQRQLKSRANNAQH